ncbi:MAG: TolC family protein, partial [Deltaproteobacteria bacterium]|nr:TolC family protein [Deltaproteobacteria bacterium]
EGGVAARVPFDWLARRGPETDAARAEAEAARSGTSVARREVLARVAERFWAVAHGDATAGALAEAERHAAGLAAAVRLRVEAGEARPSELPRVETDLARTSIELEKARSRLRADRRALEALLGLPATADGIVIAASIDANPPLPAREAAFAAATQSHPALAAARSRARAGAGNVAAQKARRIPAFSVGARRGRGGRPSQPSTARSRTRPGGSGRGRRASCCPRSASCRRGRPTGGGRPPRPRPPGTRAPRRRAPGSGPGSSWDSRRCRCGPGPRPAAGSRCRPAPWPRPSGAGTSRP